MTACLPDLDPAILAHPDLRRAELVVAGIQQGAAVQFVDTGDVEVVLKIQHAGVAGTHFAGLHA